MKYSSSVILKGFLLMAIKKAGFKRAGFKIFVLSLIIVVAKYYQRYFSW
jgi:hypothetical protein